MKLPYGISNFARLIEDGYHYVDKTRYIEQLENEPALYLFLETTAFWQVVVCFHVELLLWPGAPGTI